MDDTPRAEPAEPAPAWSEAELQRRIDEEIEDFENGAACARRADLASPAGGPAGSVG